MQMNRIRVLYVISSLDPAGAQRGLINLANNIDHHRLDTSVCCLNRGGVLAQDLSTKVKLHILNKRRGLGNLVAVARLFGLIRRNRYHIVYTHLFIPSVIGRLAALLARTPVIMAGEHGLTPCKPQHQVRLDRLLARWTDRVTAVSEAVAQVRITRERIPADKMVVIPNAVDLAPFEHEASPATLAGLRQDLGIPSDSPCIGIVARLTPIKDIETFIDACSQVAHQVPAAYFLVAGDGELRAALEERAAKLTIASHIKFLGMRADVPLILQLCDVCALTSLSESCPLTVLEYMAAGRPVVATRVGGTPEFVLDGETGILIAAQDPDALAGTLLRLLKDKDLRMRLGAAGKEQAQLFSAQHIARRHEELYRGLLESKGVRIA